jgi:hypothetical protein
MKKAFLFACSFVATSMIIAACGELTGPTSPETPINVAATLTGPTTAVITWARSPQSDGVISYNILRNGTKIGEATGTTYTDNTLGEKTTYKYTISANCTSGVLSDPSPESSAATVTTADLTGPRIVAISPTQGQIQVSTAATVTATFNEALDPNTINTTTFSLKGPTGANIPGTVTYNSTTFVAEFKPTSALPNGSVITATVTAGVKDVAGNALQLTVGSPGIWSFTTRDDQPPTVSSVSPTAGATVAGNSVVNITFSEAMDPTTINATNITLRVTGGAAVAGAVTYNTTTHVATFTPSAALTVPQDYTITVTTGVKDVAGNALASAFTSTFKTADLSTPTVISTSPAANAVNVPVNSTITATFSKAMDPTTITAGTFLVKTTVGGVSVLGSVTYNAATNSATFTPTSPLASQTAYTVTVTGVKDTFGTPMAAAVIWTFSTLDTTPPTVSVVPTSGSTNIATNATVQLTFSEAMDQTTINTTNITVKNTNTSAAVVGTIAYNPSTFVATFTPTNPLANGTNYTVTVTTAVKDASGNALLGNFVSNFTTVPAADTTPPTVTGFTPTGPGNPTNSVVTVTFSEAMQASTINTSTILLLEVGGSVNPLAATVTYDPALNKATLTPTAFLKADKTYQITVTTGVKDVAGNAMTTQFNAQFSTAPDTTAPTVIARTPTAANSNNVPVNVKPTVTFSEDMDPATITTSTFFVSVTGGAGVPGSVTYDQATRIATFAPSANLTPNTSYTVTVTTGAKDLGGNGLTGNFTFSFTTAP